MKRLAFVVAVAMVLSGCGGLQVVERPEGLGEDYSLGQSFDEYETPERVPVEIARDVRPHHYGEFDWVSDLVSSRRAMNEALGIAESIGFIEFGSTLTQLEPSTENIVRGRMGNDARIELSFYDIVPERPSSGRNFVSFEILEVIKGDLAVSEIITIMESYFIHDRGLITVQNYLPSIPYQEYILFLSSKSTSQIEEGEGVGAFWVLNDVLGRFPVPTNQAGPGGFSVNTQDFSPSDLGLGSRANFEIYFDMWQEVLDAFIP